MLVVAADAFAQESPFSNRIQRPQQPPSAVPSRPLPARPDSPLANTANEQSSRHSNSSWGTLVALAVVIGLIIVIAKFWRRFSPVGTHTLPSQAVNILGRKALDSRHSLTLLKCGSRIIVLGFSPHGMHTLTEISDAAEVDVLNGLCSMPTTDASNSATFRDFWMRSPKDDQATSHVEQHDPSVMEGYASTHA
ncbi:FliO/MopB family protein [Thalassoroseus pseudoceratinae]|uniref:FliO/MopB family protein n=1 Tax=Thalassoroseus pseudoceratinae TaxID=2713176 RepID=UPI0014227C0A|nr:flagellar biosynthetic protein FliO [Thalassoroseus pseudoceratinae]